MTNETLVLAILIVLLAAALVWSTAYLFREIARMKLRTEEIDREIASNRMRLDEAEKSMADADIKYSTELTAQDNRYALHRKEYIDRIDKAMKRIDKLEVLSGNLDKWGDLSDQVRNIRNHVKETDAVLDAARNGLEQVGKLAMTNQDSIDAIRRTLADDEVDG